MKEKIEDKVMDIIGGHSRCYKCGTPVSEVAIKLENAKKGGDL